MQLDSSLTTSSASDEFLSVEKSCTDGARETTRSNQPAVPLVLHKVHETHHLDIAEILDQILSDPEAKQVMLAALEQHTSERSPTLANATTETLPASEPEAAHSPEPIVPPCDDTISDQVPAYDPSLLPFFLSDGIVSPSDSHTDVWGLPNYFGNDWPTFAPPPSPTLISESPYMLASAVPSLNENPKGDAQSKYVQMRKVDHDRESTPIDDEGFRQVPFRTRFSPHFGIPSAWPRPGILPLHNRYQVLEPPSSQEIEHPQQSSIVGDHSAPAIYAPNHNITLNPHIIVTPERVSVPPMMQPTPPETDKASPPAAVPALRRSYRRRGRANPRTPVITRSTRNRKPPASPIVVVELERNPRMPRINRTSRATPETTDATGEDNSSSMDIDDQPLTEPKATHGTSANFARVNANVVSTEIEELRLRLSRLEDRVVETKEQTVDARNQTNATRLLCIPRLNRIDMDLAEVTRDLARCKACVEENHDLHIGLAEVEDGAEERLSKINDCLTELRSFHNRLDELGDGLSSLRRTVENERVPPHECQGTSEVSELKFRFDLLLDNHNILRRQFDCLARMATNGHNLSPVILSEARPQVVTSESARHWVSHLMDVAKSAMPDAFGAKALDLAHHRINECTSTTSAIAAILWSVLDFLTIASEMSTMQGLDRTTTSLAVLRLYNVLQPITRHALVTLALAPGGWAHDSRMQTVATRELSQYLTQTILRANIKGVSLSLGEPYTGFDQTARDRWLPALTYGSLPSDSPRLLLASPPVFSFDNIDAFFCTHVSAPSWHTYLARSQPRLARIPVPLFSRPMFPNPWHPRLQSLADAVEADHDHDEWTTGEEAAVAIVSWVGRVLLTEFVGPNQSLEVIDAREAIEIYHDARTDIANTVDSILRGIIAHGVFKPSISLTHAAKFLSSTLERIADTAKHCTIRRGSDISLSHVNATSWLPTVLFHVHDTNVDDTNPAIVLQTDDGREDIAL